LFGTGAAIVFKGSGFYQTDYRSEGYKKAAAADKGSGDSTTSATNSESKGKDKSEPKKGESPKKKSAE
jgi:predicted nucleic acid-binding Zn ribbon protein